MAGLAIAAALLAGCATAPRHPAVAEAEAKGALAPLVPVRRFVANVDFRGGYLLSPDGRSLLWSQAVGLDAGLAARGLPDGAVRTFATGPLARSAGHWYAWLPDSRHFAYVKDPTGDENTQLHVADAHGEAASWHVTPWPGTRSTFVAAGAPGTTRFFFATNRRERAVMDLYEADAATRTVREVARSEGPVLGWLVGTDHRPAGRARQLAPRDGSDIALEVPEPDGRWRTVRTVSGWDFVWMHTLDPARGKAWGLSNQGRDKGALVEVDLASGAERVLAEHPVVDLQWPYYAPASGQPVAYVVDAGMPTVHYLDEALGRDVAQAVQRARAQGLLPQEPLLTRPQNASLDGRRWILRAIGDFDEAELLLDRDTGAVQRLDAPQPLRAAQLVPERPFSFTASDGRRIHGYLIRPRGVEGPAPLVVRIHGGPWVRDQWSPAGYHTDQLLANRGYAVLTVNYRGSWGYGRDHMMAGRQEYFGRTQQDIAEATAWAVREGIADRQRMAVLGASFGGFSVMAQLIRRDHDWRCGVNIVGVANWARVVENWPPFWRNRHLFEAFFGDVNQPAERERMMANSPISHVERITAPMLVVHGANDVRVLRQDSDDVVAGLRALGRPVEYLLFDNEGHSVRHWRNRMAMWRRIEDRLADCLGGRSAGWDFYELMPR